VARPGNATTGNLPKSEELQKIADTFKQYPKIPGIRSSTRVLDLLRAFIAEFPGQHQKQALLTLLDNGFQKARTDTVAGQAESRSSGEFYGNGAPSAS
jgi:hypothetical protein